MTQKTYDSHSGDSDGSRDDPDKQDTESKSQRKRNAHLITQLASQLVEMKPKARAALPLESGVREAIEHCAEIKAHGARKRQLHFVSKLLRESGSAEELQVLLQRPDLSKKNTPRSNPHTEICNQLISNFADHVETLREHYPVADLQQVRQLVRNAHNESRKALEKKNQKEKTDLKTGSENGESPLLPQNTRSARSLLKLLTDSHK